MTMTLATFRRLALSMPQAFESAHMGHPDFRVGPKRGRIFATLFTPFDDKEGRTWGMVKLTPGQQRQFVKANPRIFLPVRGGWGERGATQVHLRSATIGVVRQAMRAAWSNAAPKRLLATVE